MPKPHHVDYLVRFFRNSKNLDYLNFDNECRKNEGYESVAAYRKFHSPSARARTCGKMERVQKCSSGTVELRCAK